MPTLEAQNISVSYGPIKAVEDVSFRVDEGEIVALVGSNGAGKSTTLKAVMGLKNLTGGDLRWGDHSIARTPSASRVLGGIALSPEGRRLFPGMSVFNNLEMGAYTVKCAATRRQTLALIYDLFPRVHERRAQLAGSLSGGEQQMVAIGRALMAQPRLLLLDEPSLGLAPKVIAEIVTAVETLNRETGLSIILVEQNARLALRMSHRAYVLERGQIVRTGTGQALLNDDLVRRAYLGV